MQGSPKDPLFDSKYLKVSATCKHYDAYDLENWGGVDRHHFDALVEDFDFQFTYLPVFRACAQEAKVRSVMCSYNAVNGIPSCAHGLLQNQVMRGEWGWDGFIVSDCGAINDIQYAHNYTQNVWDTCQVAIEGGCDLNCGSYYTQCEQAVEHRTLKGDQLRTALKRVLSPRFELGLFDPPAASSYEGIGGSSIATPQHTQLALEAARQSMTLLWNVDEALPLAASPALSLALIGPSANATTTLLGNYYGMPSAIVSPLQGIQAKGVQVTYVEGCDVACNSSAGFAAAAAAAAAADVTVLVMGLDQGQESEGLDRTSLALPGLQRQLVREVAQAAASPPVVVLVNGGPLDVSSLLPLTSAVLEAFYPGERGGTAIADVLFGDYNPGGKLPYTIYPEAYVNKVSMFTMRMRSNDTYPGRSYKYYDGASVFPFGYGLSYTTWEFTNYLVEYATSGDIVFRVLVKNTGNVLGNNVIMGFYEPPENPNGLRSQLFAFQRISLAPGASQLVTLFMGAGQLQHIHAEAAIPPSSPACGRGLVRIGHWTHQLSAAC
eukprot:TRINITY_DN306_c0_g1_i1.p1 TRINITY_DN306_c0_g1~~TRINITY_DN306_c0_g1_i1.p1  ORF type:complete len:548 (-),score=171.57 TRINITY_DN306_c0_g1_i1:401-2044(-)